MVNPRKKKIYKSGIILGYKRSLRNQNMDKVRIRISEANDINSQRKKTKKAFERPYAMCGYWRGSYITQGARFSDTLSSCS